MEPDGHGTEEGCGGNEEERELRHLKLTCVEETGKVLFISCFFNIKNVKYYSYFVFTLDLLLK